MTNYFICWQCREPAVADIAIPCMVENDRDEKHAAFVCSEKCKEASQKPKVIDE